MDSEVRRIAASWGTLAKVGRASTPAVGEITPEAPADPGGDGTLGALKLGTRFLGMYEDEWRFLWRARRSARTNFCSQPATSHRKISLGASVRQSQRAELAMRW